MTTINLFSIKSTTCLGPEGRHKDGKNVRQIHCVELTSLSEFLTKTSLNTPEMLSLVDR